MKCNGGTSTLLVTCRSLMGWDNSGHEQTNNILFFNYHICCCHFSLFRCMSSISYLHLAIFLCEWCVFCFVFFTIDNRLIINNTNSLFILICIMLTHLFVVWKQEKGLAVRCLSQWCTMVSRLRNVTGFNTRKDI